VQVAAYCASAVAGGTMLCLWRRMGEEDRRRLWRLYGWFSGLMACGSCFGAVAWSANMMWFAKFYQGRETADLAQQMSLLALAYSWFPAFLVTYAVEFLCMSAANLMVLDRMSVFVALQDEGLPKWWALAGRVLMAAVGLGNAVGLAANAAAAVFYHRAAQAYSAASAFYASNSTDGALYSVSRSNQQRQLAGSILAVQSFSEVAVLLLIIVAFAVIGALSVRQLSASLAQFDETAQLHSAGSALRRRMSNAAAVARALRPQILGTTGFIFVTFFLRSVLSTIVAVANQLRKVDSTCPGKASRCDASCYNVYTHITQWMNYTPEFQLMIILISSPVAQLVALWGTTSKSTLQLMKSSARGSESTAVTITRRQEEEESSML
jgi:hypothetical protein